MSRVINRARGHPSCLTFDGAPSRGLRRRPIQWAAVLLALVSATAPAAPDSGVGAGLQEIKAAALDLSVEVAAEQQRLLGSGDRTLNLYLTSDVAGLQVASAAVSLDDSVLSSRGFTALEQAAFASRGWCLLARFTASAPHHIHLEISALTKPQEPPSRLSADLMPQSDPPVTAAVAVIEGGMSSPHLRWIVLRPESKRGFAAKLWSELPRLRTIRDTFDPGSADDPELRYAAFLSSSQEYLQAATVLRLLNDGNNHLEPEGGAALARAFLDFGLPWKALALESQWGGAESALDLRIDIADQFYRRAEYRSADQTLGQPPSNRSKRAVTWQDLKARVLLAQGRMNEAAALLRAIPPQADYSGNVRYYNLGVALAESGSVSQGLTILERIGAMYSDDPALIALSDRANLVVGMHFLEDGQGATALPLLERVHDRGPAANRALLELGWAWIAPAGTEQARSVVGDERTVGPPPESGSVLDRKWDQNLYQRFDLDSFDRASVDKSEGGSLRRALAAWTELADRQVPDDSVPEAMLAIASKLHEIGANRESARFYARAVDTLETSLNAINQVRQYIVSAQADADLYAPDPGLAFDRELHNLPPQPAASYLEETMAGWRFRERLTDYRDARVLAAKLEQLSATIGAEQTAHCPYGEGMATEACGALDDRSAAVAALQTRLAAVTIELMDKMREPLLQELASQQRWRTKLATDARFAAARIYDQPE